MVTNMGGAIILIALLIWLAVITVCSCAGMWKTFEKAGVSGIKSIIPILNLYHISKIATGKALWFGLLFLPFVNFIALIVILIKLPKAFGKGIGTIILLMFASPIAYLILGFDDSQYLGPQ